MPSYRQILYHIIFCTKGRKQSLSQQCTQELYRYIWGIIKNKRCTLYRINGMNNHIHILSDLQPSISLADYIRDIKRSTSEWLKSSGQCPTFDGWGEGYAAFTYAYRDKDMIVNYIKNQQQHHKSISFEEEYRKLLEEHNVLFDEQFLFK